MTSAGSRLLAQRLAAPLTEPEAIGARLDTVEIFVGDAITRQQTRELLHVAPDMARALSRLVVGRGGPRDLAAIRDGIGAASALAARLDGLPRKCSELNDMLAALRAPDQVLMHEMTAALADELRLFKRDGGFIRAGYDAALDELRSLRDESRQVVAQLQARYADDTGVKTLKIRHNNVLGYFVDVTAQHGESSWCAATRPSFSGRPSPARSIHHHRLGGSKPKSPTPPIARSTSSFRCSRSSRPRRSPPATSQGRRRGARRARCFERACDTRG